PSVGAAVYGATKAAVKFMSDALRAETKGAIKVTTVKPTGVPGTNLGNSVINPEAILGIVGHNIKEYGEEMGKLMNGELPEEYLSKENMKYWALETQLLAENIIYCINQPLGVTIADITVRATGERYML